MNVNRILHIRDDDAVGTLRNFLSAWWRRIELDAMLAPVELPDHGGAVPEVIEHPESWAAGRAEAAWLRELRRSALARFSDRGFPSTADEDWRFTSLAPLWRMNWKAGEAPAAADPAVLSTVPFNGVPGPRLVFVDGFWIPELSPATKNRMRSSVRFIGNYRCN